jgi:hypothetical protein
VIEAGRLSYFDTVEAAIDAHETNLVQPLSA